MKIEWIEDAAPGDWIKAKYDGHPFEGEAYLENTCLCVGGAAVRLSDNTTPKHIKIVSIERPMPPLPTEPGSVILDVVTDDGGTEPIAFFEADLVFYTKDGASIYPQQIVSFTPAKVVPVDA